MSSFDALPAIQLPENYAVEMPSFLARMAAQHGPIFRQRTDPEFQALFGNWQVYMLGPEANRFVLQSHRDSFSHSSAYTPLLRSGGFFGRGLLNMDPPEHTRQRQMLHPAFTQVSLNDYMKVMKRVIDERAREWTQLDRIDIFHEARKMTLEIIAEALMGFQVGGRLHTLLSDLARIDSDVVEETYEQYLLRSQQIREEVNDELARVMALRRHAPGDDILSTLLQSKDHAGQFFSDQQLIDQLYFLLVAGLDTTSLLSAWLLYSLAAHPEYLERVLAELESASEEAHGQMTFEGIAASICLELAMKETARLYSPVGNLPRLSTRDITFRATTVPAGTWVWLSLAGCHRLPHLFHEPDFFDPERFAPPRLEDRRSPYAFIPFGGGPRVCIGTSFAWTQVKMMAASILCRFRLSPVQEAPVTYAYYKVIASLPDGLHLHIAPRP